MITNSHQHGEVAHREDVVKALPLPLVEIGRALVRDELGEHGRSRVPSFLFTKSSSLLFLFFLFFLLRFLSLLFLFLLFS